MEKKDLFRQNKKIPSRLARSWSNTAKSETVMTKNAVQQAPRARMSQNL